MGMSSVLRLRGSNGRLDTAAQPQHGKYQRQYSCIVGPGVTMGNCRKSAAADVDTSAWCHEQHCWIMCVAILLNVRILFICRTCVGAALDVHVPAWSLH